MGFIHFIASQLTALWVIQLLEEAYSITFLCRGFPKNRMKALRFFREFGIIFAVLFLSCFLCLYFTPSYFIIFRYPSFLLLTSVYLMMCAQSSKNAKLMLSFSMTSGAMCISSLSSQAGNLCSALQPGLLPTGVTETLMFALIIPYAIYLRRFSLKDYENAIPNSGVLLMLAGSVSIFGLLVFEEYQMSTSNVSMLGLIVLAFSMLLAITMIGVYVIYDMCQSRQEMLQLQNETERLRNEKEMSSMTAATLEDLRCLRHELKHQYSYIKLLLSQKNYQELERYCDRISGTIPTQLQTVDCGNVTLNVLLNMWIGKARHNGIEVQTQLIVPPSLPFSEDDLCALISNLMDNAVEACQENGDNTIRLSITPWRDYLSIVCSNPTKLTSIRYAGGGILTTKADLRLHGYGTRIISRTAERNNGMVDYSITEGWFVAKVLLDMNMEGVDVQ